MKNNNIFYRYLIALKTWAVNLGIELPDLSQNSNYLENIASILELLAATTFNNMGITQEELDSAIASAITAHLSESNPHNLNPTIIGAEADGAAASEIATHLLVNNPHNLDLTAGGIGATTPQEMQETIDAAIAAHLLAENPHELSAYDVGAEETGTVASAIASISKLSFNVASFENLSPLEVPPGFAVALVNGSDMGIDNGGIGILISLAPQSGDIIQVFISAPSGTPSLYARSSLVASWNDWYVAILHPTVVNR